MTDTASRGELLQRLVGDYLSQKQTQLLQLRRGGMEKEDFLADAAQHISEKYLLPQEDAAQLLEDFAQYIFGYSVLSPLIDDPLISDIRVIGYDRIRIKREGKRMDARVSFSSEKEYRQFVDYAATKNQVSISNLNAIQCFTDTESHPEFILRFTLSMPLVNTYREPYLCIRKVPKHFPQMRDLVEAGMMEQPCAEALIRLFRSGSTLICGGNSSGKTTLLNALKETLPDDLSVLVVQQADELTTQFHPDTMFLHSVPQTAEGKVSYDLKAISIAGLTMDVDCFIIGEIKGAEALYLLNAACTGQLCAGTIHSSSPERAADKLVDYAMYESSYSRNELMRMMDCFQTLIFMKNYRVSRVLRCRGWDEERKELLYDRIF